MGKKKKQHIASEKEHYICIGDAPILFIFLKHESESLIKGQDMWAIPGGGIWTTEQCHRFATSNKLPFVVSVRNKVSNADLDNKTRTKPYITDNRAIKRGRYEVQLTYG
jgi:hypothetical protein